MTNYEAQKNITMFLLVNTGSIFGIWSGRMTAKKQRALFGHYMGKGTIKINGSTDTITHVIKVAYGQDVAETGLYKLVTGNLVVNNQNQVNQKYL